MDSETLFAGLDRLASSGVVLSVEQKASLQSSLVFLKKNHKFRRVKLWGIIRGIERDYFIVHGVGRNELLDRKALYSQDCVDWHLLPYPSSDIKSKARLIQGRFKGDPSFQYEHTVTHRIGSDTSDDESTSTIEMKEEERLSAVVSAIDEEAAVVPRGAYVKAPLGDVVINKSFRGLSVDEAKRLNYYYHFQTPTVNTASNNSNSIKKSIEFLESIDKDIPKGCWSVQCDQDGITMVLRSLVWLGMVAYHVPCSTSFGYFYCGMGEKNPDLLFML